MNLVNAINKMAVENAKKFLNLSVKSLRDVSVIGRDKEIADLMVTLIKARGLVDKILSQVEDTCTKY